MGEKRIEVDWLDKVRKKDLIKNKPEGEKKTKLSRPGMMVIV